MSDDRFKKFERVTRSWNEDGHIFHEGERLLLSTEALYYPTITVKLTTKWYALYLIHLESDNDLARRIGRGSGVSPNVEVYKIHFGHLDGVTPHGVSPFRDHVPNPDAVRLFARRNEFEVDELASDLIAGRWQNEAIDWMECDRCDGKGQIPPTILREETCRKCRGLGVLRHNE